MIPVKKAVYYMCTSEDRRGLVSRKVWEILENNNMLAPGGIIFDGQEVKMHEDEKGNTFYFVPTEMPVCWDYPRYLPDMNKYFADCQMAGVVTWHEGTNAPSKVLTVHSIGDVNAGIYGPINVRHMRNILLALERNRTANGLEEYKVVTEATHWSGTAISGSSPELILKYPVPIVDIEVGSEVESWEDPVACAVLANSLTEVFQDDEKGVHNVLCVGGIHFDPNFAEAVFAETEDGTAYGISHIIANQWLVSGQYEEENGLAFIRNAIEAIEGGIELIAFHDKMKACYKDLVRLAGKEYNVPIVKHQGLRNPLFTF